MPNCSDEGWLRRLVAGSRLLGSWYPRRREGLRDYGGMCVRACWLWGNEWNGAVYDGGFWLWNLQEDVLGRLGWGWFGGILRDGF